MATELSPATAGWGFVVYRIGVLEGLECECWGEVLLDERDPRSLGADSLSNNAGELWALAELQKLCYGFATSRMTQVGCLSPLSMTPKWLKAW